MKKEDDVSEITASSRDGDEVSVTSSNNEESSPQNVEAPKSSGQEQQVQTQDISNPVDQSDDKHDRQHAEQQVATVPSTVSVAYASIEQKNREEKKNQEVQRAEEAIVKLRKEIKEREQSSRAVLRKLEDDNRVLLARLESIE